MNTRLQFIVRRAVPADAEALARLRFEFRSDAAPPVEQEDTFFRRCVPWMNTRLADERRWRAWVLHAGDAIAGTVWLQLVEKIPNPVAEPETHGYVTNLFVRSGHRNHGGGSSLLSTLLNECSELAVDAIFLWPTPRSRGLYERYGFVSNGTLLVRSR